MARNWGFIDAWGSEAWYQARWNQIAAANQQRQAQQRRRRRPAGGWVPRGHLPRCVLAWMDATEPWDAEPVTGPWDRQQPLGPTVPTTQRSKADRFLALREGRAWSQEGSPPARLAAYIPPWWQHGMNRQLAHWMFRTQTTTPKRQNRLSEAVLQREHDALVARWARWYLAA